MSITAPKKTVPTTGGPRAAIGLIALSSPCGCIVPGKFSKEKHYQHFKVDPNLVKHWITDIDDFKVTAKVTHLVKETQALSEEPHKKSIYKP